MDLSWQRLTNATELMYRRHLLINQFMKHDHTGRIVLRCFSCFRRKIKVWNIMKKNYKKAPKLLSCLILVQLQRHIFTVLALNIFKGNFSLSAITITHNHGELYSPLINILFIQNKYLLYIQLQSEKSLYAALKSTFSIVLLSTSAQVCLAPVDCLHCSLVGCLDKLSPIPYICFAWTIEETFCMYKIFLW